MVDSLLSLGQLVPSEEIGRPKAETLHLARNLGLGLTHTLMLTLSGVSTVRYSVNNQGKKMRGRVTGEVAGLTFKYLSFNSQSPHFPSILHLFAHVHKPFIETSRTVRSSQ